MGIDGERYTHLPDGEVEMFDGTDSAIGIQHFNVLVSGKWL